MSEFDLQAEREALAYRAGRTRQLMRTGFLFAVLAIVSGFIGSSADVLRIFRVDPYGQTVFRAVFNAAAVVGVAGVLYVVLQFFLEFGGTVRFAGFHLSVPVPEQPRDALPKASALEARRTGLHSPMASATVARLKEEIRAQSRRANANLGMGLLAAAISLGFLAWLALRTASDLTAKVPLLTDGLTKSVEVTPMLYWGAFFAKVALSIAANVFAFFFLSTYRRNLAEIRYFQNELTNVENHYLSLFFASEKGFEDAQKKILVSLASTERNFVLRKGESTVDLGIRTIDSDEVTRLSKLLISALSQGDATSQRRS